MSHRHAYVRSVLVMEAGPKRMVWLCDPCGVFLWTVMSYVLVEEVMGRSSGPLSSDPLLRKRPGMRKKIESPSGRHIRDIPTVTAVTGQSATLLCPTGSLTPEEVQWETAEGSKLPANSRHTLSNDGALTIEDISQSTDGGTYKCSFLDSNKRIKTSVVVLRILDLPSLSALVFPSDMIVGMRLRAMCSILRGDPPLYFSWLKEGKPLPPELGLSVQYFRDYSMISSDSVQLKHSGNYTCLVNNDVGTSSSSSVLKINAPPTWLQEPQDTDVVSGRTVQLVCAASGLPTPTLTWKRAVGDKSDSYVPVYNSHKYTVHPNGTLSIQDAGPQEAGEYLCQATNGFGGPLNKVIKVTVREPAQIEAGFKSTSFRRGDKAFLVCEAKGDLPLKMTWRKEGLDLDPSHRLRFETVRTDDRMRSELHIKGVTKEDGGVYQCQARNAYGKDEDTLKLSVQEVPNPPSNITVLNMTGRSALLTWTEPFNGNSAILGYAVEYKKTTNGVHIQNASSETSSRLLTITGLTPATRYNVRVRAQNGVGWGEPSEWFSFATEEEPPGSAPSNVTTRATGPNSVKVSWQNPSREQLYGSLLGFLVGYRMSKSEDAPLHKTVEVKQNEDKQETHLTNLRRATPYLVAVRAYNKKGQGPPSQEVAVKTLDDVPPSAPVLDTEERSPNSITLSWRQRATFGNPVTEYVLHMRKEGEPWKQIPVSTSEQRYDVHGLECGTNYKFYMTAHNSVGKSEPSETITARTEGAAPISPGTEEELIVRQREVSIPLQTWKPAGCTIQFFTIKIRNKSQWQWKILDSHLAPNQSHFVVKNLVPGTDYELNVQASSSAGSTELNYALRTLEFAPTAASGSSPVDEGSSKSLSLASDVEIIVPVVVSAVVVLVVLTVGLVLCSRDRRCLRNREGLGEGTPTKQTCEAINMKEIVGLQQEYGYSEEGTLRPPPSSYFTSHYHGGPSGYFSRTGS